MKLFTLRTIRSRLIFSHLFVSLASIILVSLYAGQVLYGAVRRQVEHHYEDLAFAAANDVEQPFREFLNGKATAGDVVDSLRPIFDRVPEMRYTLYLPDGVPLIDSSGELPPQATRESNPQIWHALERSSGEGEYFYRGPDNSQFLLLAVRIEHDDVVYGLLHLTVPLHEALATANRSLLLLVVSALLVGVTMGVVGFYLARGLAQPIRNMTQTAEILARGEMGARVLPPTDPEEIHRLAEAFNNMAGRLQGHVDELRSFVANASHELRTPLTSIKLRVEALRNGALDDPRVSEKFLAEIESEVDRLSSMVNDLLDLSRIEAGLDASKRLPVDLNVVANEVYEAFKVRAERSQIHLSARVANGVVPIMGNEDQLRRMLYNLVDNALKYTPHGGRVEISLEPSDHIGWVVLMVKDNGFGIAAAQLPHIFERFYRVEATRPRFGTSQGSGLGLPIAKTIAEAHGGQIGVTSQIGKGTTFWVELPYNAMGR